jgi:hypothetical protein
MKLRNPLFQHLKEIAGKASRRFSILEIPLRVKNTLYVS